MNVFRMKEKHRINVPQFDEEHHQLFEIVDHLRQTLLVQPDNLHGARQTFAALEDHTRIHFANEERIMQRYGYPGFYGHRQIHVNLLAQLANMAPRLDGRRLFAAKAFNTSIAIWLTSHITSEDAKLGQYMLACDEKRAALAT